MKKVTKVLALLLAFSMIFAFAACGDKKEDDKFKVGFIFLHDENSTYDKNFIDAALEATKALGLADDQVVMVKNIAESEACLDTATDLVNQGCDIIFADSFGHEDYMIQAAKKYPEVQFCHATGTRAGTEGLKNYHNAFASIYEGRYLAGIAAGMKLNEMIEEGKITADEAKMGYVGAYTYAEVISGYSSFYLGAKSVCPTVTMDVQFTGEWYHEQLEKEAAEALIAKDCVLISQHADSMGAPTACETAGVPNISYNGSTKETCPNTFIVSSRIDWTPYFKYMIETVQAGKEIDVDWCGGISEGSVVLTEVNTDVAAEGTQEAIDAAKEKFEKGELEVFDTATFTVNNEQLTTYKVGDVEVIKDGIFEESEFRSAPYFDLNIDGINRLNEKI